MRRPALTVLAITLVFTAGAVAAVAPKDSFTGDHGKLHIHLRIAASSAQSRAIKIKFSGKLSGTLKGSITKQSSLPDTGRRYTIVSSGRLRPLGKVLATGTVIGTGFIASGHEQLRLQLSSARKKEVVNATSPPVPGFTSP